MSSYTITYSTRKTIVIEDQRTKAKIELSPVSHESSKLLESLPLRIVERQPIEKIREVFDKISGTSWEQAFMVFFFFWISEYYQEVLNDTGNIWELKERIKYLRVIMSEILGASFPLPPTFLENL
jgi:hypothetical protein